MDSKLWDGARRRHALELDEGLNKKYQAKLREWRLAECWKRVGVVVVGKKKKRWEEEGSDGVEGLMGESDEEDAFDENSNDAFWPAARRRKVKVKDEDGDVGMK